LQVETEHNLRAKKNRSDSEKPYLKTIPEGLNSGERTDEEFSKKGKISGRSTTPFLPSQLIGTITSLIEPKIEKTIEIVKPGILKKTLNFRGMIGIAPAPLKRNRKPNNKIHDIHTLHTNTLANATAKYHSQASPYRPHKNTNNIAPNFLTNPTKYKHSQAEFEATPNIMMQSQMQHLGNRVPLTSSAINKFNFIKYKNKTQRK
jgi:hypothetical protein